MPVTAISTRGTLEDLRKEEDVVGYASRLSHGVVGQGLNDYDKIFSTLNSVGFSSWISIEDGMNGDRGDARIRPISQAKDRPAFQGRSPSSRSRTVKDRAADLDWPEMDPVATVDRLAVVISVLIFRID